ncbi:dimethylmenaquinone methyltransferase [Nitzschia inconspicua]|uniref:Dimethylmenaquinone methyltransferase n=1 Tax=Nitzschia inconspicua TaxID=303405 RepID=A0A9K3PRG9_9STRA|nr:dimethylmenaquinone methyltransferase [Nitzschia inconspicua]
MIFGIISIPDVRRTLCGTSVGRGFCFHGRRLLSAQSTSIDHLLQKLRTVDTSALCDADKTIRSHLQHDNYGIRVMDCRMMRPMNHYGSRLTKDDRGDIQFIMAGIARTVQFTEPNDFLPVLRGLQEASADEVLVVNTLNSTRAVAGEIFFAQAQQKGLVGIVIDGPIRDTRYLSKYPPVRMYASSFTPYAGTTQSVGKMQRTVECGGVTVRPGEVLVGDEDGVLVGSAAVFEEILPLAQQIQETERKLLDGITAAGGSSKTIADMSNSDEHILERQKGSPSKLQFRVS